MEKSKVKASAKPAAPKAKKSTPKTPRVTPVSHGVGRRKSAVARVWMRPGKGALQVNGKDFKDYFDTEVTRTDATIPFQVVPVSREFDVQVNVAGGGLYAQAGAIKLGIARALVRYDESLRPVLRQHKLLTVDARRKERKKYGQPAARRKFQFVKR